ncbi:MAG: hypothetical protein Q8O67_26235 [Deltaproteobacteria bacterium]|nr:hypothetical protein [Deltaproteobacteria bacterium]
MITAVVVVVVAVLAAAEPVPAALQGIDQIPTRAMVASLETRALTALALDDKATVVHRTRALRLLGAAVDVDDDARWALVLLRSSPIPVLRVQAALAQGALAAREEQLVPFAAGLLHDDDAELRRAALTLLWIDKSPGARDVVFAFARSEKDPALLQLANYRLKNWPTTTTKPPKR